MKSGDLVSPNIRLVHLLGEGGMGTIWVADHLTLQTQVVVKFIIGSHASDPQVVDRFRREAALSAQARSQHVVSVLDYGISESGVPFIAMERLAGEDLGARLRRTSYIPPTVFAEWLRQIAKGLTRAHSQGIIHRDIKPENLFLCDEDGEITVKILDFGVAKGAPSGDFVQTNSGALVGTAYYMSPEQAMASREVDFRADLWALGVVTYFALTDERPFNGSAIGQLVNAIASAEFTPPTHHRPELPSAIDEWMGKALAREPEQRFGSAREMAAAFYEACHGPQASPRVISSDYPVVSGEAKTLRAGLTPHQSTFSPHTQSSPLAARENRPRRIALLVGFSALVAVVGAVVLTTRSTQRAKQDELATTSGASNGDPSGMPATGPLPVQSMSAQAASVMSANSPSWATGTPIATTASTTESSWVGDAPVTASEAATAMTSNARPAVSRGAKAQPPRASAASGVSAPTVTPVPPIVSSANTAPQPKSPLQMRLE